MLFSLGNTVNNYGEIIEQQEKDISLLKKMVTNLANK